MKGTITIAADKFRDKPILMDLFDMATTLYEQHAKDESLGNRMREQFVLQKHRGANLTMQLWHQEDPHAITFQLAGSETDRWLILNMMMTGIDVMNQIVAGVQNGVAKALYLQRIARAEELREMVEDAEWSR